MKSTSKSKRGAWDDWLFVLEILGFEFTGVSLNMFLNFVTRIPYSL